MMYKAKSSKSNHRIEKTVLQRPHAFFSGNKFFQPKRALGPVDDHHEKEVDAIAERVTKAPFDTKHDTFFAPAQFKTSPAIQSKCASCGEEDKLQRKETDDELTEAPSAVSDAIAGSGDPLDDNTRSFMENRFMYDFSKVKIHTGNIAAKSAQSINALAYTSGSDIVFNNDQYSPGTESGKKLLAHELTHVVQQNNGHIGRKLLQRQTSTVTIGSTCNRSDIIDIVTEALTWLDDIYSQLLSYDADETFSDVIPPGTDHARISAALQQAFNTTDLSYVEVIRRRFLHLANLLRSSGRITVNCSGQYCSAGGSSFTAAYVIGPYALTMCSVGTSGSRPVSTFIHELIHAAIPQTGIRNDVTTGERVTDRAYRDDRVFRYLSPEETLDNADSYGILAQLLHSRSTTALVAPQSDTTSRCSQPDVVLEAFARAEQWHNFALHELDVDVSFLQGNALSTLAQGNLDRLNRTFPNITTTTQLIALRDAFQQIKTSGFNVAGWSFKCVTGSDTNCRGNAVYSSGGRVSASSVTLRSLRVGETARICPDWFSLSHDDKIRTIYAAFIIGRPSWITTGLQLANVYDYVDGARVITSEIIPAPTTTSASEHIERDRQAVGSGVTP